MRKGKKQTCRLKLQSWKELGRATAKEKREGKQIKYQFQIFMKQKESVSENLRGGWETLVRECRDEEEEGVEWRCTAILAREKEPKAKLGERKRWMDRGNPYFKWTGNRIYYDRTTRRRPTHLIWSSQGSDSCPFFLFPFSYFIFNGILMK